MKIHHLNCTSLCPLGGEHLGGEGDLWTRTTLVCHCLLVEGPDGLILVDTGFGLEDIRTPNRRMGAPFVWMMQPRLDQAETAIRQVTRLGFKPEDVRHIVLTHLDLDHAGGLADFPWAKVHVYGAEHAAAMAPATFVERERYRSVMWEHGPDWALASAPEGGERWFGLECVRDLPGLPPEVLMVPMPGHTRGHAAVAVQGEGKWALHAGDAYFYRGEVDPAGPHCPGVLGFYEQLMEVDHEKRLHNQARLRELARDHGDQVTLFCAHDPVELARLAPHQQRPAPGYAAA
ncbi:MBL fold metallo-hydrolase [Chondromyces apiculatus]|uniref:Metallo-beta-lactamase domain-containing protein n=1 Tax=Chondromyces apiculatus DSM 436 TaxID=1192034 RepID=A0A017T5B7_9BACT|nr:MBL fold metallo-hydrolase [Chondromyces apiculatus]EYF03756.1 Hypothetical protein CAP_5186 [Chondromyces apiculatus DSM 436]